MNDKYILASASPRRKEILAQVGISFEVMASNVPEVITETVPDKMVMELAGLKSDDVSNNYIRGNAGIGDIRDNSPLKAVMPIDAAGDYDRIFIIGADTMVFCGGLHMGKPSDEEDAFRMLKLLQGNTHQVITGVCINEIRSGRRIVFSETTNVTVVGLEDGLIRDYIRTGECTDKAGAYAIQGLFSRYIERIDGDYYNVVGFPICRFCETIRYW